MAYNLIWLPHCSLLDLVRWYYLMPLLLIARLRRRRLRFRFYNSTNLSVSFFLPWKVERQASGERESMEAWEKSGEKLHVNARKEMTLDHRNEIQTCLYYSRLWWLSLSERRCKNQGLLMRKRGRDIGILAQTGCLLIIRKLVEQKINSEKRNGWWLSVNCEIFRYNFTTAFCSDELSQVAAARKRQR